MNKRISRDKKTLMAKVRIYCRDHHQADKELCSGCSELLD